MELQRRGERSDEFKPPYGSRITYSVDDWGYWRLVVPLETRQCFEQYVGAADYVLQAGGHLPGLLPAVSQQAGLPRDLPE